MTKRHRTPLIALFAVVFIFTLFKIDEARHRDLLQTYLQEQHQVDESAYTLRVFPNQFGYSYSLTLHDEPDIAYNFYGKRRDGIMHIVYYGYDAKQGQGLRDREFETVNYALLESLFE
ncbi:MULTISPECIES: hypothetical protein [Exiguobacterium]|uniref:hypothetical protein n=1 Tax=Exiguobacterium TaxID=33986 RepID=UPI001BE8EF57|nr:hypothetical protein [Exiguobacterium sp. s146]